ncbi:MAG: hypothetical protein H6851_03945 [Geminicoccaceae bacterium]|nr:hypothetical protein [Geminicoccaceae bacterium]MCB9942761.1 hypothetical protein [Geminicoccaceae bacterium]
MNKIAMWRQQPLLWRTVRVDEHRIDRHFYKHNTELGINGRLVICAMSLALWTGIVMVASIIVG